MMTPPDVTQLVVLGTADRRPASLTGIVEAAQSLAPLDWQPTSDTILATVERALARGLMVADLSSSQDESVLRTTPLGRSHILALMRAPVPRLPGSFVRTCMSVKACFLDQLPLLERSERAAELAALYRDALAIRDQLNAFPSGPVGSVPPDLRSEIVRLDSELAWLEAMAAWKPLRLAAE